MIDIKKFEKEWSVYEHNLMESEEYVNADKLEREEMLYEFDLAKNEALNNLLKNANHEIYKVKDAFHTLLNYCNSRESNCSNCILHCNNNDEKCLMDFFQDFTSTDILDQIIENNISTLDEEVNKNVNEQ